MSEPKQLQISVRHDETGYPSFVIHGLSGLQKNHDAYLEAHRKMFAAAPKLIAAARKAEAVMSKHIHPQPDKTGTPWEALKELREALKELEG